MKISRENYELYFIDLIDGTLPTDKVDELLDFMRENPDLSEELNGLKRIKIDPVESIKYNTKSLLKSDFDQPDILEEALIRSIENDLTEKEEIKLQRYISTHSDAENDYRLFNATLSEPDSLIVFQAKNSLKRNRKISPFWYSVAAILLIGMLFWFNTDIQQPEVSIARATRLSEIPVVVLHQYQPKLVELKEQQPSVKLKPTATVEPIAPREVIVIEMLSSSLPLASMRHQITDNFNLAPIENSIHNIKNQSIFPGIGELLANKFDQLETKKEMREFAKNALTKIKGASNKKLDYTTNTEGRLSKIEFNTKLLAFSFPVNSRN